jgi:hypothetical protein
VALAHGRVGRGPDDQRHTLTLQEEMMSALATPQARRGAGLVTVGLMLGVSLAALDMTIVATAVRTIADDLGGLRLSAWASTAHRRLLGPRAPGP